MITNKGNQIITKFMLGQAPEYAAYIAVGVGATPLTINESDASLPTKSSMDFEAFRVPVTSKGVVSDEITLALSDWTVSASAVTVTTSTPHGMRPGDSALLSFVATGDSAKNGTFIITSSTTNTFGYEQAWGGSATWSSAGSATATVSYSRDRLVFKAQLPQDQRYLMSEVALYPSSSNTLALSYDSRLISGFLPTESWAYHHVTGGLVESINSIPLVTTDISDGSGSITTATFIGSGSLNTALFVNSDNNAFTWAARKARHEPPRLFNRSLIVAGDMTAFTDDDMTLPSKPKHIINTANFRMDLSKSSPDDYIRLALSLISKDGGSGAVVSDKVRLRLEFEDSTTGAEATATRLLRSSDFASSRYVVVSWQLKDFSIGTQFNWNHFDTVELFVQTLNSGGTYDDSYVAFDGLRLDNVNTENPLYGMTAYSRLKNGYESGALLEKAENSQGYIEYRLGANIV